MSIGQQFGQLMHKFRQALPMTTRVVDINPYLYAKGTLLREEAARNFELLFVAGGVTRIMIGILRTIMDHPRFNNGEGSRQDKMKSTFERFFIELVGTTGYLIALAFGQDIAAKVFEAKGFRPKQLVDKHVVPALAQSGLPTNKADDITKILSKALGEKNGIIDKILFGLRKNSSLHTVKQNVEKALGGTLPDAVAHSLNDVYRILSGRSSLAIVAGLLTSALFGGVVMQYVNDYLFAPIVVPKAMKLFGIKTKDTPENRQPVHQYSPAMASLNDLSHAYTPPSRAAQVPMGSMPGIPLALPTPRLNLTSPPPLAVANQGVRGSAGQMLKHAVSHMPPIIPLEGNAYGQASALAQPPSVGRQMPQPINPFPASTGQLWGGSM